MRHSKDSDLGGQKGCRSTVTGATTKPSKLYYIWLVTTRTLLLTPTAHLESNAQSSFDLASFSETLEFLRWQDAFLCWYPATFRDSVRSKSIICQCLVLPRLA